MNASIQTKLLTLCILLVLLSISTVSVAYYRLAKQNRHRESRQRIQIAFDIMLDDGQNRAQSYTTRVDEFLKEDDTLRETLFSYQRDERQMNSLTFLTLQFATTAKELKHFGQVISAHRLTLYGANKRLLTVCQYHDEPATMGFYAISQTGSDTYLPIKDITDLSLMFSEEQAIPDTPLPPEIAAHYEGELPDRISTALFSRGQQLGFRITAPIFRDDPISRTEKLIGVLVGEVLYTERMVARYAALSQTEINLFAGTRRSLGTLLPQTELDVDALERSPACDALFRKEAELDVISLAFDGNDYYQGHCAFKNAEGDPIGAITVSLSQVIEHQEVTKLLRSMLLAAGLVSLFAIVFSLFASRTLIRFIQQVIRYIDCLARGEIPAPITTKYKGEFNDITHNLNQLIGTIHALLQETDHLSQAVQEGRLDCQGDAETVTGGWRELIMGVNYIVDAFVTPINVTAAYIEQLSEDTIPDTITDDYKGDFNKIKQNLNLLGEKSNDVLNETNRLIYAVREGQLDVRGHADRFGGGWRELIVGLNGVLDAFTTPIQVTAAYLDGISVGDIPTNVSEEYQGDFNVIIQRLNQLIHNMRDITQIAERMANGDLTIEVHERSHQDVLMQALQKMLRTLNSTVRDVKTAAEALASRSREMSTIAEQMSEGASEQAAATEEVTTSMEEMAANVTQNAHNAGITEKLALQSAEDARKGLEAVTKIITAMRSIAEHIVSVREIANQTNILSLNATIEAAKAEEYGKGFAVVASSVRDLAQRSRDAADDIDHQVRACVHLSKEAGDVLQQLVPNSEQTAEFVQNISVASQEQRSGAAHINQALQQLDSVTQHNAATADQLSATAEALAARAEQLQHATQFFQVSVEEQPLPEEEEEFAKLFQSFLHAPETDKRRVVDLLKQVTPPASTSPPDEVSEENALDADWITEQDEPSGRDARDEEEFERY